MRGKLARKLRKHWKAEKRKDRTYSKEKTRVKDRFQIICDAVGRMRYQKAKNRNSEY